MLSAKAGTPLAEVEALVAAKGQQLAFEPMDSTSACSADRRARHDRRRAGRQPVGAAPDQGRRRARPFPGLPRSPGRGETFKSGGRVVKNVTGYDLCKLIAGLLGHAGGDDRGHHQGAAAAGDRARR